MAKGLAVTHVSLVFARERSDRGLPQKRSGWGNLPFFVIASEAKQSAVYWHGQRIKGGLPHPLIVIQKFMPFV